MLIRLLEINEEQQLRDALARPAGREAHALYITEHARYAKALADRKLPCIYIETEHTAQRVYGADLVIVPGADGDAWKSDKRMLERVWKRHYGIPWTIAQAQRLRIRESTMEDLAAFVAMYGEERGNPDVQPFAKNPEEALYTYIHNQYPLFGYGLWSVEERSSGRVIGRMGLEQTADGPQLSYLIRKAYRRRGYAKEAARALLGCAKEQFGLEQVRVRTSAQNTASRRLAQSLCFHREPEPEKKFQKRLDNPVIYVYDL